MRYVQAADGSGAAAVSTTDRRGQTRLIPYLFSIHLRFPVATASFSVPLGGLSIAKPAPEIVHPHYQALFVASRKASSVVSPICRLNSARYAFCRINIQRAAAGIRTKTG
jgi:hypothetical protein